MSCEYRPLTVRLHRGGRCFTCPCCGRVREHPPLDTFLYLMEGHAYCDLCGRWLRIENYRTFETEEEFEAARRRGDLAG